MTKKGMPPYEDAASQGLLVRSYSFSGWVLDYELDAGMRKKETGKQPGKVKSGVI